jgi:hypothetical protein
MTDSLDITQLILEKHPNADKSILDRLRLLIEKHNLKWIFFEQEVTFVMQHICEAKGVELNDFAKNYIIGREYYLHGKALIIHSILHLVLMNSVKQTDSMTEEGELHHLISSRYLYRQIW